MLNNPENTEEIVNKLNEVEIKIKNLKTLLKNKEGRFCISEDWGQLYNPRLLIWFKYSPSLFQSEWFWITIPQPWIKFYLI